MNEAKYQWSINKQGTGEIFVVRGDDFEEWNLDIEAVKTKILLKSQTIEEAVGQEALPKPKKLCPVHNMTMEQKWSERKQSNYWSHVFNGELCFGHK